MSRVKICGITSIEEARMVKRYGAWALGEVFADSSRKIDVEKAAEINRQISGDIIKVGVFVNENIDLLKYIIRTCSLDMVQLHGEETPEYAEEINVKVIKCFSVADRIKKSYVKRWRVWAYLFDTHSSASRGGTGRSFDWQRLDDLKGCDRLILAGGLNHKNVGIAIKTIRPMAVDVSTGVEFSRGGKSPDKIEKFINTVKEADGYVSRC